MEASPKIEKEVIDSCKAGDEKAFGEVVLAYQRRVYNIAYRMLGNKEEAKDLAQEVFLSVFESIKTLREEVKFEPWLIQITINHCRNRWKYLKEGNTSNRIRWMIRLKLRTERYQGKCMTLRITLKPFWRRR